MKRHTITLPMLIFIAVLFVSMAVFPTAASGSAGEPDAVAGGGAGLYLDSRAETYNVIASAHSGGAVMPSVSDSAAGKTVSFSVDPSSGYETASVAAITAAGNMLQVVRVSGEKYSFVMPEEAVVIDVTFQFTRT